jgi:biopolymer transport protein ExbD
MSSGGGEEGEFGLQIAPILDLLFVLLLFFMISAGSKAKENELGIKIPSKGSSGGTQDVPIMLKLDQQGQVYWNDSAVDTARSRDLPGLRDRLKEAIAKFGETQPVIISPNRITRHERVIDVLNAASAAGVKNLAFGAASS